jgi:sigma-B regulation protein RsbU (phosphoserine phosphatase)
VTDSAIHLIANVPERDMQQVDLLTELGQEFAQSIDIQETLSRVVNRIADYMNAEAASVFLINDDADSLECRACAGPVDIVGLQMAMGQGIVGRTAKDNICQLVRDVGADPDFSGWVDRDTGFHTRSILCTPLRSARGVIGVLQVLNKRDGGLFDDHDRSTLTILASPTALAINNARMASELVEQARIKKELSLARQLQRSLLPRRRETSFPLLGINMSAREVSGDFYDFFELTDGRIAFCIGDVSGKGMNAALLMVRATSLLRWIGKYGLSPGDWLSRVNNELYSSVSRGMFVCAMAGYYDPASDQITWANAGFPPPLLCDSQAQFSRFRAQAPPLAIVEQSLLPEHQAQLGGGVLYMYSDGVTEARDGAGKMLQARGFQDLISKHSSGDAPTRLSAIVNTLRRLELRDDTTILMLERCPL